MIVDYDTEKERFYITDMTGKEAGTLSGAIGLAVAMTESKKLAIPDDSICICKEICNGLDRARFIQDSFLEKP